MIAIQGTVHKEFKHVTLCIDFHFVNGVMVLHTISRRINYRTVSFPLSRSRVSIMKELKMVFRKYNDRDFQIADIHADREFEKLEMKYFQFDYTPVE